MAVLHDKDIVLVDAGFLGKARVLHEHAVFAVHRDEIFRLGKVEHEQKLFLTAVPGDVREAVFAVDDVDAQFEQVVDRAPDASLVPRNWRRRDDHRVAAHQLDLAMIARGHARQRRHGLALAAGRADHDAVRRMRVDLVLADELAGRDDEIAVLHRDARNIEHAPADETHLAAVARGGVHRLLQTRNVGSEHRDDDAAFGASEDVSERLAHHAFRKRVAGNLGVGRVGTQQQHAFVVITC